MESLSRLSTGPRGVGGICVGQQGCYSQNEELETSTRTPGNNLLLATYFNIWPHKPNACYLLPRANGFIGDHTVTGAIQRQHLRVEWSSLVFEAYGPSPVGAETKQNPDRLCLFPCIHAPGEV